MVAADAQLVERAIARDPEAVRALVKKVGPVVHGRVAQALMRRRNTGDQRRDIAQEVDDLSQEVFRALFDDDARALRGWSPEREPLDAFVALIADNQLGAPDPERSSEEEADPDPPEGIPAFDATAEDRIATRLLVKPKKAALPIASPPQAGAANVVRPRRWMTTVTPVVALAAGIALFVAVRGKSGERLPAYALSVVSAGQVRAPSAQPNATEFAIDPDGELEIVAHPAVPLQGLLAEAIVVRSGEAKPWIVPIDISKEGALRVAGDTRELFPETIGGPRGTYDVAIFVAGMDALPSEPEAMIIAKAPPTESRKFRVIRARIRFVEKK